MQRAQERLQALIDHIPAVVYRESADADPEKFFISPQVEQILGLHRRGMDVGPPTSGSIASIPDDRERVLAVDAEAEPHAPAVLARSTGSAAQTARTCGSRTRPSSSSPDPDAEAVVARPPVRRDGAQGGRGAAASQRARPQRHGRAPAGDRLPRAAGRSALTGIYISPQVQEILGFTAEEWIAGEPDFWLEHIHPDDVAGGRRRQRARERDEGAVRADYRFRHADGSLPLGPRRGHVRARRRWRVVAGLHHRHHASGSEAEDQLREAEEKFRTDRRAGPGGVLPAGVRPRRSGRLTHDVHLAATGRRCSATPTRR